MRKLFSCVLMLAQLTACASGGGIVIVRYALATILTTMLNLILPTLRCLLNELRAGDLLNLTWLIRCAQTTPTLAQALSGNDYSANIHRPI